MDSCVGRTEQLRSFSLLAGADSDLPLLSNMLGQGDYSNIQPYVYPLVKERTTS